MPFWNSVMGVLELDALTSAAVMSNGLVIFNIAGDIILLNMHSKCITPNGASATTIQYNVTPSVGAQTSISAASASLANAIAGTAVGMDGTTLATAPNVYPAGVGLGEVGRGIIMPAGNINLIVAVGPTTGTWIHYIRYRPMAPGAAVTPAF